MLIASGAAVPADGIAGWVSGIMESFGAVGAGLATVLDTALPFIPSEVVLPAAGFAAGQGKMSLIAAIGWTTVGAVAGALVIYALGALLGRDRTRRLLVRVPLISEQEIDRTEAWFARHGYKTVFFGRMVPVFRNLFSVPAGIERMPLGRFALFTGLGSLIWNTAWLLAGYWLGDNWYVLERYAGMATKGVAVLTGLAVVAFVTARVVRRRGPATSPEPDRPPVRS